MFDKQRKNIWVQTFGYLEHENIKNVTAAE